MSQNTLALPTSGTLSGLAAVEAINAALDTLNTLASGASGPSTPEAGQIWHDSANNLLKIRSLDNTTWITLGALNESTYQFSAATKAAPNLYGLTLSNDTSSPNSVIDIAVGGAYDNTAAVYMRLSTALKKNVTAAWAAGAGNGSLDTGTVTASTSYHVHLIENPTSGATDILTSRSYTNPVLPSGFTYFVPIGAVIINASTGVTAFIQEGDRFLYANTLTDINGASFSGSSAYTLTGPSGIVYEALVYALLQSTLSAQVYLILESGLGSVEVSRLYSIPSNGETLLYNAQSMMPISTNTSGQIIVSCSSAQSGATTSWSLFNCGFIYPRGLR